MNGKNRLFLPVALLLLALVLADCALLGYAISRMQQAPAPTASVPTQVQPSPTTVPLRAEPSPTAVPLQDRSVQAAAWPPAGCPYAGDWVRRTDLDSACSGTEMGRCRAYVGPGQGTTRALLSVFDHGMVFSIPLMASDEMLSMFADEVAITAIQDCGIPPEVVAAAADGAAETDCLPVGWCYFRSLDEENAALVLGFARTDAY